MAKLFKVSRTSKVRTRAGVGANIRLGDLTDTSLCRASYLGSQLDAARSPLPAALAPGLR